MDLVQLGTTCFVPTSLDVLVDQLINQELTSVPACHGTSLVEPEVLFDLLLLLLLVTCFVPTSPDVLIGQLINQELTSVPACHGTSLDRA